MRIDKPLANGFDIAGVRQPAYLRAWRIELIAWPTGSAWRGQKDLFPSDCTRDHSPPLSPVGLRGRTRLREWGRAVLSEEA
jgi:hypothetical protein